MLRLVKNEFNIKQRSSNGAAFKQHQLTLDGSEDKINFGTWDTPGSERYRSLAPMVRRCIERRA
eukprot:1694585-Prymnesium_polylepis.3